MKCHWTWDAHGNLYYANQLDSKWCLVVCRIVGDDCANEFLELNSDCSVIADIDGLVIISFTEDLGKRRVNGRNIQ